MFRISSLLFLLLVCVLSTAKAQVGQSPYTVKGIGSIHSLGSARNLGMGGVGIGNSHYLYLNNMNPAMLTRNSFYTTFEVGMNLESRNFDTGEQQDQATSGGMDYLSLAFPVVLDKMTLNVGIAPYSTVSYNMNTRRSIDGTNGVSDLTLNGSGGTSQAYAATGVKLLKGLSAGIRASYIFGAINEEIINNLELEGTGPSPLYSARYHHQTSFSDVLFSGGLAYSQVLNSKKQTSLMAGLTYDWGTDLNAERFSTMERAGVGSSVDTLAFGLGGDYYLPPGIGAGISYERLYRYTFAGDFKWQNWENYRGFDGANDELGQSYRAALGAEWIPDYAASQPGTYYKRMTYRMGLQYEQTPFLVNEEKINDFGITFGLSLPIANASTIHTSMLIGQRGAVDNGLIRERYFRFTLGVTFNDRWFTKVKYD